MSLSNRLAIRGLAGPTSVAVLPLFAATLFTGAFLVFSIQPLFAKLVLPLLGGAPAVWNTTMVFFQGALLAGYAYAHALGRYLAPTAQRLVHLGLLAVAGLTLPLAVGSDWQPQAGSSPVLWLFGLLTVTVGPAFFAVAATAPLIQHWFAGTGHPQARDPYFLYAASNIGSLLGLLAYPFVVEPLLPLHSQSVAWAGGYGVLMLCIAACAFARRAEPAPAVGAASDGEAAAAASGWREQVAWIAYAAVPSALLLGATQHITTDIAAVPFLWVLPLSLYLLTFILAFASRPPIAHRRVIAAAPYLAVVTAVFLPFHGRASVTLVVHLAALFALALACHGELARRRPPAAHLTRFYLMLSLGGLIGGTLTAIAAPLLFDGIYEYPLAIVAAVALLPAAGSRCTRGDVGLALGLLAAIIIGDRLTAVFPEGDHGAIRGIVLVGAGAAAFLVRTRPLALALALGAIVVGGVLEFGGKTVEWQDRSFFGVYRVARTNDGAMRLLKHGTTLHGAQWLDDDRRYRPTTYFAPDSPAGRLLTVYGGARQTATVGVIGLGAGNLACYRRPGQQWTFFEIDPLVVRIARDTAFFDFLGHCTPDARMIVGDGRLTLAREADGGYDVLVLDVFSSDAIPLHLLTREAVSLYLQKLKPDGVLLLHISNRHLDLTRPMARLAAEMGLTVRFGAKRGDRGEGLANLPSHWLVAARSPAILDGLTDPEIWKDLPASDGRRAWDDDYSNILDALKRRL